MHPRLAAVNEFKGFNPFKKRCKNDPSDAVWKVKEFDMKLGALKRNSAPPAAAPRDEAAEADGRPPSVSADLWRAVPAELREDALRRAARGMVRSVHPEETITEMLKEKGLPVTVPAPKIAVPKPPVPPAAPASPVAGRRIGGLRRAGSVPPPTPLGAALASMDRPELQTQQAEASLMAAIRKDPVMAYCDPTGLAGQRLDVPTEVLSALANAIHAEAENVVAHYRQRKAAGDPALADWTDPDDWSFNLDGGEDCQRSPSI